MKIAPSPHLFPSSLPIPDATQEGEAYGSTPATPTTPSEEEAAGGAGADPVGAAALWWAGLSNAERGAIIAFAATSWGAITGAAVKWGRKVCRRFGVGETPSPAVPETTDLLGALEEGGPIPSPTSATLLDLLNSVATPEDEPAGGRGDDDNENPEVPAAAGAPPPDGHARREGHAPEEAEETDRIPDAACPPPVSNPFLAGWREAAQ